MKKHIPTLATIFLRLPKKWAATICRALFCLTCLLNNNAHAGGGLTGGSTEWTQILNWVKLAETYTAQVATLVTTINQLDFFIRQAARNPLGVLPSGDITKSLLNTMNNLQDIGSNMNEIDARWSHAYLDPPDGRVSTRYSLSNNAALASTRGALMAIGKQQQQFKEAVDALGRLKTKILTDSTEKSSLDTISQATVMLGDIASQIQITLMAQTNTLSSWMSAQTAQDDSKKKVNDSVVAGFKDPPPYVPSGKAESMRDVISMPTASIQ